MSTQSDLYDEVRAGTLVGSYQKVLSAVKSSSAQVEQYPNSPYSRENAETLTAQATALRHLGAELRAWHRFIYQLQNADEGFDKSDGV